MKGPLQKYMHHDKLSTHCGKGDEEVKKNKSELGLREMFRRRAEASGRAGRELSAF